MQAARGSRGRCGYRIFGAAVCVTAVTWAPSVAASQPCPQGTHPASFLTLGFFVIFGGATLATLFLGARRALRSPDSAVVWWVITLLAVAVMTIATTYGTALLLLAGPCVSD
jgi:hypothetical protein